LDATDQTPIKIDFLRKLAKERKYDIANLTSQTWALTFKNLSTYSETVYMWDNLAVAYLGCENLSTFRKVELDVSTEAPSEGKSFQKPGSGHWVNVAHEVDADVFEQYYLESMKRDFPNIL